MGKSSAMPSEPISGGVSSIPTKTGPERAVAERDGVGGMRAGGHAAGRLERGDVGPSAGLAEAGLYDAPLLFFAGCLMVIGVTMAYSASVSVQGSEVDWRQWWNSPLRQGLYSLLGFFMMLVAAHADYRMFAWWRAGDGWRSGTLYVLAMALLVAVLIPGIGVEQKGAVRAIYIPGAGIGFQPSELAKVVLVVWVAALLTRPGGATPRPALPERSRWARAAGISAAPAEGRSGWFGAMRARRGGGLNPGSAAEARGTASWSGTFLPVLLSGGALIALTGIEDYGTAALMGLALVALLYMGGARLSQIGFLGLLGVLGGVALLLLKPYRRQRLLTFFSDAPDPLSEGYQVTQSLIAIGSGGWLGRGLGAGVQKYGYLPQDNNDFVFAIICEELGIVGGIVVIALYLAFLWRGWRIAAAAADPFGRLLAAGLTLTICLQAAFNIAVVTNLAPTKGISLPLVSSGGSGVVFLGLAAGLLASVARGSRAR